jgi:hypothetical protein
LQGFRLGTNLPSTWKRCTLDPSLVHTAEFHSISKRPLGAIFLFQTSAENIYDINFRRHLNRHAYFSSSCCAKCRWRPDQAVDAELALLEHLNLCFNQDDLQSFISTVVEEDRQEFEMEPFLKSYFELSKFDSVKNKDVITRFDLVVTK